MHPCGSAGKHWHVEHFVCAKCEKPFLGNKHYERKGLAYCETHYHQLFGNADNENISSIY